MIPAKISLKLALALTNLFLFAYVVLGSLQRPALGGLTKLAMMKSGGLHITRIRLKEESLIQLMIPLKIGEAKGNFI